MQTIVLVVPCFNEAPRLRPEAFEAFLSTAELTVLFVNDGSTDNTRDVLNTFCARHPDRFQTLHLPKNVGKGEAVRRGLLQALSGDAEIVGYLDADLATPPSEMTRLIEMLKSAPPDVWGILGSRIKRLGATIERKTLRHILGRCFATAASWTLSQGIYDTQCGAKVFRRHDVLLAAVARPFRSRWIFDVELLSRLLRVDDADASMHLIEAPLLEWMDKAGSKVTCGAFIQAGVELLAIYRERRSMRPWKKR
jgi:dolichyl-phosphate beta-glucosyltransferase